MFDTKNYFCECPKVFCEHRYPVHPLQTAREEIALKNAYERGYFDGERDEMEHNRLESRRFRDMAEQERFVKLLQGAMKPLEQLIKDLSIN